MHTKNNYITTQSFWMFVAGLIVGLLIIIALMTFQNIQADGQTRLLRNWFPIDQAQQINSFSHQGVGSKSVGIGPPSMANESISVGVGPPSNPVDTKSIGVGPPKNR